MANPPPHANHAATHGGVRWDNPSQPPRQTPSLIPLQTYIRETTALHNHPTNPAATHGGAQPPQGSRFLSRHQITGQEITALHRYLAISTATNGRAQPPPPLLRELMLMHRETMRRRGGHQDSDGDDDNDEDEDCTEGLAEEVIARLLKTTSTCGKATVAVGGDPEVCAVCLDDLHRKDQTVGVLRCGQNFHGDCIGEWLQKKNVCPLCKAIAIEIL